MDKLPYSTQNWYARNLLNHGDIENLDYAYTGCNTRARRLRRFHRVAAVILNHPTLNWDQKEFWLERNAERAFEKCHRSLQYHHNKRKKTTKCQCYECTGTWYEGEDTSLLTRPPLSKKLDEYFEDKARAAEQRSYEQYQHSIVQ